MRWITCLSLAFASAATATANDITERVAHHFADNGGVKIHYVTVGEVSAPLVVMVHGFPDFWLTWRDQMTALQDRYRVAALDLRGYNQSDKPEGVAAYAMPNLVADVAAVIAAEGRKSAVIVGHDWGGAISWNVAMRRPELVNHLIILNLPHPAGLARELASNTAQQQASQYAYNFQQPGAEKRLTAEALAGWVSDAAVRNRYVEAFRASSMEGMLNYYKANYPPPAAAGTAPQPATAAAAATFPKLRMPVLMFHGLADQALLPGALAGTWDWIDSDYTLVTVPGAGHFVQQDASAIVSQTMRDWLDRRVR